MPLFLPVAASANAYASSLDALPMQDCLAILLFAFCGGVLDDSQEGMMNDPTSQANRYDVSVGWKFTKLQQLLVSSEAIRPHYPSPQSKPFYYGTQLADGRLCLLN